jgi:Fic family protein
MIFQTPPINRSIARQLTELDGLRARLGDQAGIAGPWLGRLRREWRASSAESSIEIEGFHVPAEETLAVASGNKQPDPRDENRMALSSYARAMDHVGVMSDDPAFRWVERVVLDLHFDACHFQKDKDPGRYRRSEIKVTSPRGGPPAYLGPPHEKVPTLMGEVVGWLDHGDVEAHVAVRAAMAHLHLVSLHPFRDGNGRIARIVQSLVLAREGLLAPEFVSIEEYLGRNTDAYYATLEKVQGGSYQPKRDAAPWVRFCVQAHLDQARRRLTQLAEAGKRWSFFEELVEQRKWPDRLVIALEQSIFTGVDRASYAAEAEVSAPTASNDFRRLQDAGLIVQQGRGPTTRYVASENLRADLHRRLDEAADSKSRVAI